MQIEFVYFDIGGVMFEEAGSRATAEALNVDYSKFRKIKYRYLSQALVGQISSDEMVESIAKHLGVTNTIENHNDFWASRCKPIYEMHDLAMLVQKKVQIGILTNNILDSLISYKKYDLIPDIAYDVTVESSKVGIKKPDKAIYTYATKKAKVDPNKILFIDDRSVNLLAARELDWHTSLFERDNVTKSIDQIKEVLKL